MSLKLCGENTTALIKNWKSVEDFFFFFSFSQPTICAACKEVVRDPVELFCGHSSCKQCVESASDSPLDYACPKCGKKPKAIVGKFLKYFLALLLQLILANYLIKDVSNRM